MRCPDYHKSCDQVGGIGTSHDSSYCVTVCYLTFHVVSSSIWQTREFSLTGAMLYLVSVVLVWRRTKLHIV